jgi:membrane-bound lytic murein transglycosylase B
VVGVASRPSTPKASGPPPFVIPELRVQPGLAAPGVPTPRAPGQQPATQAGQSTPAGQPDTAGRDPLRAWAERVSAKTQVPARALVAYANADLVMRQQAPACRISWSTLAGIGRVESHHGGYGGAILGEDGRPSKPIIGVPLDGSPGVQAIRDTDGGRLDGDPVWDHAVGPMQFLPGTWLKWGHRASADGNPPDPQNIDDAALTAAAYLCGADRDLSTGSGWWSAILSYNNSVDYGQQVFSGADAYAKASNDL